MYVNTNVAALNAWQNLYNTQQNLTQTLQQLSSGNRINSAADDPAGLAISQEMQTQISGMQQASQNAQSGISLLQTADGALAQIQNILQSMHSLASEAASGTMNPNDTQALQAEMNQYTQEITSITNQTAFNTLNLLGGTLTNQNIQIGPDQNQTLQISLNAADAYSLGITGVTANVLSQGDSGVVSLTTGLTAGDTYNLSATVNPWSVSTLSSTAVGTQGDPVLDQATGLTGGDTYSLAATVTPWSVSTLAGANKSDFTSLTGTGVTLTSSDAFSVTVVTAGASGVTAYVKVFDYATNQTTTYAATGTGTASTFDINVDGNTFTLATATATLSDTYTATVDPTKTVFSLTQGATTLGTNTVYGVVGKTATEGITFSGGAVTFSVDTSLATDTSTTYTATSTTLAPAASLALTATTFAYTVGAGDFTSLTGSGVTLAAADTFSVRVVTVGNASTAAQIAVTDTATNQTTTYTASFVGSSSTFNINVDGSTFALNMGTATLNDTVNVSLDPTNTVFSLTQGGTTVGSATVDGVVANGATEAVTFSGGAVTFTVGSTLAGDTSASYSASATTLAAAAEGLSATTFDYTQTGNAAQGANGTLTVQAAATFAIDITTQANAQAALGTLTDAINQISTQRGNVGAYENRLQFANSDMQVSSQNLQAANAGIMNADMAMEMAKLSQYQILQQSGVAMLAQANQMPQALLKLIG